MSTSFPDSNADLVMRLMFDYSALSEDDIAHLCESLPPKIVRWLAVHHPDNRTRLIFYRLTGVAIGEGTVINSNVILYDDYQGLVTFGKRVAVAADVSIVASSGPNNSHLSLDAYVRDRLITEAPIWIEDDVWLCARCVILPGVTVGAGSIVAAGAVVTKDVPPWVIVAGTPARPVRKLALGPLVSGSAGAG